MLYYTLLTYYYLLTFSISKIGSVLAFSKLTHFNPRQLATPLYSNIVLGNVCFTIPQCRLQKELLYQSSNR